MPVARPRPDLFAQYLGRDLRPLLVDVETRPAHYSAEEHETVRRLVAGESVPSTTRSALLLTMLRRTEARALEQKTRREITAHIVTPDKPPPAFEQQDLFAGTIKLV